EELLQSFGVVAELAPDVYALQRLVVQLVSFAKVSRHLVGIIQVGDSSWVVRLARHKYLFGTASEVGLVLISQGRARERVPAESIRIPEIGLKFPADGGNPHKVKT